jgi:hypothetical protein
MLFDRVKLEMTMTKPFKSRGLISALQYGPYDNGHILVGLTTGDFFAFDSITLRKLCNVKISHSPISSITIEPIQMVLIGVRDTQRVAALTFIENKQKYFYVDLGHGKYATVIAPNEKRQARSKSAKRNSKN